MCTCDFTIAYAGVTAIQRQLKSSKHISHMKAFHQQKWMTTFLKNEAEKNAEYCLAEAVFVYHTVSHGHSYLSADCSGKLLPIIFSDSTIAKYFECGRTKCVKVAYVLKHAK